MFSIEILLHSLIDEEIRLTPATTAEERLSQCILETEPFQWSVFGDLCHGLLENLKFLLIMNVRLPLVIPELLTDWD